MRRNLPLVIKTACLILVALLLLMGFNQYTQRSVERILPFSLEKPEKPSNISTTTNEPAEPKEPNLRDGNATLLEAAPAYIKAIMDPENASFPRLECPRADTGRYQYLANTQTNMRRSPTQQKYFFALDLHQCASLLPRLISSIVETMRFLGPEYCTLSIIEGRSDDGTYEILKTIHKEIEELRATYFFNSSSLAPGAPGQERITTLAELRNAALEPLIQHPENYSPDTTVIFLNDVSICMQDILELIHQRRYQNADMTCAMDWVYVGADPTFYDVWIARDMNGELFFNIPSDGNWDSAWNLFWKNEKTQGRFRANKPFQVFSCWNGATAFTAKPIMDGSIRFRRARGNECFQGEPKLFCKDMWHAGFGKIAVVPSVNLEYSDEKAKKIKALKGYVSDLVSKEGDNGDPSIKIEWESNPPEQVKCMPSYSDQSWRAWDEGL